MPSSEGEETEAPAPGMAHSAVTRQMPWSEDWPLRVPMLPRKEDPTEPGPGTGPRRGRRGV